MPMDLWGAELAKKKHLYHGRNEAIAVYVLLGLLFFSIFPNLSLKQLLVLALEPICYLSFCARNSS